MFWNIVSIIMVVMGGLYSIPQLYRSIKQKDSHGLSIYFILFWLCNELISLIYVSHLGNIALMTKYCITVIGISIILFYKKKGHSK
jgi:uncharacterized protein with PQ loop repeat